LLGGAGSDARRGWRWGSAGGHVAQQEEMSAHAAACVPFGQVARMRLKCRYSSIMPDCWHGGELWILAVLHWCVHSMHACMHVERLLGDTSTVSAGVGTCV
jgi:hypothetical protein